MADAIHFTLGDDGVALLTIDVAGASMNIITPAFFAEMGAALDRIASEPAIKGAVIASGKPGAFMGGADLKNMLALVNEIEPGQSRAGGMAKRVATLSNLFRRLETIGKPIAIAVNGTNMGGGFELMLACHYRVASDDPRLKMGLPEVLVGLLPGAGGTQRLPRLAGIQPALPYLLQGKTMSGAEALAMGVVQEIAPKDQILERARAWVVANPTKSQAPWDVKGFKFPGGAGMFNPGFVQTFMGANAMVQKETWHNYNAPQAILSAVYEGSQLPIDRALAVEVKYMTKLFLDPQSGAMIRTLFINKQAAERGARRPAEVAPMPTKKVAMVGAGLMGAGIAMVSAQAGIEVALLDRDQAAADKGKDYTRERLEKRRTDPAKMADVLGRIHPTASYEDLAGVDLIIEAVFEDPAIKKDVTAKIAAAVGPDVLYGSNTSTLPITGLQANWPKPENFIGIHFFSPVEKMQLVEIIVGKQTGPTVIAKALDYVRAIGKTPIVVNDSRGFYTSRCFATYVDEGAIMVAEGINPALIENCGRLAGMPVGPLAVGDEVAIDLMGRIKASMISELGAAYTPGASDQRDRPDARTRPQGAQECARLLRLPRREGCQEALVAGPGHRVPPRRRTTHRARGDDAARHAPGRRMRALHGGGRARHRRRRRSGRDLRLGLRAVHRRTVQPGRYTGRGRGRGHPRRAGGQAWRAVRRARAAARDGDEGRNLPRGGDARRRLKARGRHRIDASYARVCAIAHQVGVGRNISSSYMARYRCRVWLSLREPPVRPRKTIHGLEPIGHGHQPTHRSGDGGHCVVHCAIGAARSGVRRGHRERFVLPDIRDQLRRDRRTPCLRSRRGRME